MNEHKPHGIKRWFRRVLCREREPDRVDLPDDIREASHRLSNASAELQGAAQKVIREGDAFVALAQGLRRERK